MIGSRVDGRGHRRDAAELVEAIVEVLGDASPDVRREAAAAVYELDELPARLVPLLQAAARDASPRLRYTATTALAWRADADVAQEVLLHALTDPDPGVLSALVDHGPRFAEDRAPVAVACLVAGLAHPAEHVRARAVRSLGDMETAAREALPALERALSDPADEVREEARRALDRIRLALRLDLSFW
jgi:vesicle coat complex subunit